MVTTGGRGGRARGGRRSGSHRSGCGRRSGDGSRHFGGNSTALTGLADQLAPLHLDHHLVGAAMAEGLLDLARLDRGLETKRLAAQCRFVVGLAHRVFTVLQSQFVIILAAAGRAVITRRRAPPEQPQGRPRHPVVPGSVRGHRRHLRLNLSAQLDRPAIQRDRLWLAPENATGAAMQAPASRQPPHHSTPDGRHCRGPMPQTKPPGPVAR